MKTPVHLHRPGRLLFFLGLAIAVVALVSIWIYNRGSIEDKKDAQTETAQAEAISDGAKRTLDSLCAAGEPAACDAAAALERLAESQAQDDEVQDSEIQEPEVQESEIDNPDPDDPETQNPESDDPDDNDLDPNDPESDDPDPDDPEIQDPEVQDPEDVGPQGPQGEAGQNGTDGSNGADGTDGRNVVDIQCNDENQFVFFFDRGDPIVVTGSQCRAAAVEDGGAGLLGLN